MLFSSDLLKPTKGDTDDEEQHPFPPQGPQPGRGRSPRPGRRLGPAIPTIAAASQPAPTTVTIIPENDGFYGYVASPKTNKCANGRKVTLLKQLGTTQDPHSDQKIGSDIAQPNGDGVHVEHRQLRPHEGQVLRPRLEDA